MSLFSDIVNSIGGDKPPAPPRPPVRPNSANSQRPALDTSKPSSRPGLPAAAPSPLNGTKRKADDGLGRPQEKVVKPNALPGLTSAVTKRVAAPPLNAPRPSTDKIPLASKPKLEITGSNPKSGSTPPVTPTTATAKAPTKGSYADIMARAKQAQEARTQSQVGMIKHQATNREKVSKVAERKRQEEEKTKAPKEKPSGRPATGRAPTSRSVSPVKRGDQAKVPKVARPPLHAPPSTYKGTMGSATNRTKPMARKKTRYDEYLGTDEEDDSDMDGPDEDEEDYGSDESSDMEAGAFELHEEEQKAMRAGREEDAHQQAIEDRLKREKEERRKRLMGLAGKHR